MKKDILRLMIYVSYSDWRLDGMQRSLRGIGLFFNVKNAMRLSYNRNKSSTPWILPPKFMCHYSAAVLSPFEPLAYKRGKLSVDCCPLINQYRRDSGVMIARTDLIKKSISYCA